MSDNNENTDKNIMQIGFRTAGRMLSIQGLYQMEMTGQGVGDVMLNLRTMVSAGEIENVELAHCDFAHLEGVLRGVLAEQKTIDTYIMDNLPEKWTIKKLDCVVRAILRSGLYELLYMPSVPAKIALNEYTNMASAFGVNDNNNMVSGLLNKIAHSKNLL